MKLQQSFYISLNRIWFFDFLSLTLTSLTSVFFSSRSPVWRWWRASHVTLSRLLLLNQSSGTLASPEETRRVMLSNFLLQLCHYQLCLNVLSSTRNIWLSVDFTVIFVILSLPTLLQSAVYWTKPLPPPPCTNTGPPTAPARTTRRSLTLTPTR